MLPDYRSGNFYQKLLEEALYKEGVNVKFIEKKPFLLPIFRSVLKRNPEVIHIHWIDNYVGLDSKNIFKFLLKMLIFFIDLLIIKHFFSIKILWTINNIKNHENKYPYLEKLIRKFFLNHVNKIVIHCTKARKIIVDEYKVKINEKKSVILHGNYINYYENKISKIKARNG